MRKTGGDAPEGCKDITVHIRNSHIRALNALIWLFYIGREYSFYMMRRPDFSAGRLPAFPAASPSSERKGSRWGGASIQCLQLVGNFSIDAFCESFHGHGSLLATALLTH